MHIGEKIRETRIQKGLTQKQLGELAGIAEPTIRRYELGKLNPKLETVRKIAAALKVPLGVLLSYEDCAAIEDLISGIQSFDSKSDFEDARKQILYGAKSQTRSVSPTEHQSRNMNTEKIEQVIAELVSVSGILESLAETADSPLSEAIWGTQDYLDKIIEELLDAIE